MAFQSKEAIVAVNNNDVLTFDNYFEWSENREQRLASAGCIRWIENHQPVSAVDRKLASKAMEIISGSLSRPVFQTTRPQLLLEMSTHFGKPSKGVKALLPKEVATTRSYGRNGVNSSSFLESKQFKSTSPSSTPTSSNFKEILRP